MNPTWLGLAEAWVIFTSVVTAIDRRNEMIRARSLARPVNAASFGMTHRIYGAWIMTCCRGFIATVPRLGRPLRESSSSPIV